LPQKPHIAARVPLNSANLGLVLTDAKVGLCFSAVFPTSLLLTLAHLGAHPQHVKRELKKYFSLSITLWSYSSFLSFSCWC